MANNKTPAPDRYGVVGHPVEHSRSPLIHTVFARQTRQRLTYEIIDATPEAFETAVRGFGAAGGKGLNVTVPHKEAAFALCDESSEAATAAGAVNTISIEGGRLRGDNTDGIGFIRDVTINQRQSLAGKRIDRHGEHWRRRVAQHPLAVAAAQSRETRSGRRWPSRSDLRRISEPQRSRVSRTPGKSVHSESVPGDTWRSVSFDFARSAAFSALAKGDPAALGEIRGALDRPFSGDMGISPDSYQLVIDHHTK